MLDGFTSIYHVIFFKLSLIPLNLERWNDQCVHSKRRRPRTRHFSLLFFTFFAFKKEKLAKTKNSNEKRNSRKRVCFSPKARHRFRAIRWQSSTIKIWRKKIKSNHQLGELESEAREPMNFSTARWIKLFFLQAPIERWFRSPQWDELIEKKSEENLLNAINTYGVRAKLLESIKKNYPLKFPKNNNRKKDRCRTFPMACKRKMSFFSFFFCGAGEEVASRGRFPSVFQFVRLLMDIFRLIVRPVASSLSPAGCRHFISSAIPRRLVTSSKRSPIICKNPVKFKKRKET